MNIWKSIKGWVHKYTALPQEPAKPGEERRFDEFKKFLVELIGIPVNYASHKVAKPIDEGRIVAANLEEKEEQMKQMKHTTSIARQIEAKEEAKNPIEDIPFEELDNEQDKLIEDILGLDKILRLKYGATIEIKQISDTENSTQENSQIELYDFGPPKKGPGVADFM